MHLPRLNVPRQTLEHFLPFMRASFALIQNASRHLIDRMRGIADFDLNLVTANDSRTRYISHSFAVSVNQPETETETEAMASTQELTCQYCIDCHHTNCLTHIDFYLKRERECIGLFVSAQSHPCSHLSLIFASAYRSHWFASCQ